MLNLFKRKKCKICNKRKPEHTIVIEGSFGGEGVQVKVCDNCYKIKDE